MAKFKYVAKDPGGKTITDDIEAHNKSALIKQLQDKGYFILTIEEQSEQAPRTAPQKPKPVRRKFSHKRIKLTDLLTFSHQLSTLLESGVILLRSLEVILDQTESKNFHKTLLKVTEDVKQGSSLSNALACHPKIFSQFWVSLVEVGEASGTMPVVLNKLSFYLEQQEAFKSTVISAVIYPAVLLFVCIGAVVIFAVFVIPRFETIFTSMGLELPLLTKTLLTVFRFIREKFFVSFFGTVIVLFLFRKWTASHTGRKQTEKFLFSKPAIGKIFKLIVVERFSSQMAILVGSGVPILQALDITQRLVDNLTCAKVVGDIKESVRQGEFLVAPMERSHFFPSMSIQMIAVGEETGELSKMLKHIASFYQKTVETFMKRLATLIEPFMMVFMGGVIGVIVLSMFLPIFNLAQAGGGR